MTRFGVAHDAGTARSLCYFYEVYTANVEQLSRLISHCYASLRRTKLYGKCADNLCTASLTLCGWHRESEEYVHNGVRVSGVDRAIMHEENECLAFRRQGDGEGIKWDII